MTLTEKEQREMYSNVQVIASNCVICKKTLDDHEKRLRVIEHYYWVFFGIASTLLFFIDFIKN